MVARDPEVERLSRESTRLIARAEVVVEHLVLLQGQIIEFLDKANQLAERAASTLGEEQR